MKRKIELDELDRKCLEEMPLLLEVLSSTSSKVEKFLATYYKDMKEVIHKTLPKNWKIKEKSKLTYDVSISDIVLVNNYYSICGSIHIEKESEEKEIFYCGLGYYCSTVDDKYNCYSFHIENETPTKPLKFYEEIEESLQESNEVVIEHQEKADERELIEIRVNINSFSIDKMEETFRIFKESILIPFLKNKK